MLVDRTHVISYRESTQSDQTETVFDEKAYEEIPSDFYGWTTCVSTECLLTVAKVE